MESIKYVYEAYAVCSRTGLLFVNKADAELYAQRYGSCAALVEVHELPLMPSGCMKEGT